MRRLTGILIAALSVTAVFAAGPEDRVFFGNLHSHTSYSDGSGTPDEAYRHAREVAKLDFLALTEHNHALAENSAGDRADGLLIATDHSLYKGPRPAGLIPAARRWTENGRFVAFYGQEWSAISKGNHVNVFEVGEVIDTPNGRFDLLLREWLPHHADSQGLPAIVQFNHPRELKKKELEYGLDDFATPRDWMQAWAPHARIIELLNGPAMVRTGGFRAGLMETEYLDYLNRGIMLAPAANQDNHYKTWGSATDARTAIIARELTREALLEAIRRRHVYATEDKDLRMIFRVNGQLCGERLSPEPAAGSELDIRYDISDADDPAAAYLLEVWADTVGDDARARPVKTVVLEPNDPSALSGRIKGVRYAGGSKYFFFKLTRLGQPVRPARAWSAPVWMGPAATGAPGTAAAQETAGSRLYLASRHSNVFHPSPYCRWARLIKPHNRIQGRAAASGRTRHKGCPQ